MPRSRSALPTDPREAEAPESGTSDGPHLAAIAAGDARPSGEVIDQRPGATARELPVGAIRPTGWVRDQLRLQAEGITGQLEEIWDDVGPDSGWKGGGGEDWERGPYYLDGLIPLAWILGDERLIARAQPWIEWILASQDDTGFFGPATNRDWWPRMVAVKALEQYADATGDPRIEPFLARYFAFQSIEIQTNPLTSWGRARGADNALGVWWLYERTRDDALRDLLETILDQTSDWDAYLGSRLVTGPARVFSHLTHGPNVAMGLKTGAVEGLRRNPAPAGDRRAATERSFASLERWHGQAHGFFSGDEWLGGREATAGIETCQVVELAYTLERLAELYGDGVYGDRLEQLAFNLLPASSDPAMRGHQYLQQPNQVSASVARRDWTHSSDDANIFGLEPHFGCCTANLHQGWPKLVRSAWVRDADGALRVVTYLPCRLEADLDGEPVRLDIDTSYPFAETVTIRIGIANAASGIIRLRLPGWCDAPRVHVCGQPVELGSGRASAGYVALEREWRDGDEITLRFPMVPRIERREGQSAVVRLGPLTMALQVKENWIPVPGARGIGEWEVHPRSSWNFAISDLDGAATWAVERRNPGPEPFALDQAPVLIRARGAHAMTWRTDGAQAGPVPSGPVRDIGPLMDITLVPYGSARIRVTEFPVVAAGAQDPFETSVRR